jgi:hypothetical protein
MGVEIEHYDRLPIGEFEEFGLCPCGKKIAVSARDLAVAHVEPFCSEFMLLEPDEFLTYVRKARGLPYPEV